MTDKPDRDGILDPRASEPVAKPPEIEAFDRWTAEPDNMAAWDAARRWLAHTAGDVDEALDVARTALLLASDGPERGRARRELLDLLADRRPLAASAHFRPAANITDPLPRPILRAAGMSGAVLAEGAVCLLSGAGGAAKSTLATTLALDVAYGGELADPDGADGMGKGFSGLFDVRPGPVMMASYEDPAGVSGWRLRELPRARAVADAALGRIHVAHTAGLPLYGPPDNGLYNARPEPMRGWAHLWAAADDIRPALVVIDPALDAYTGDPNNLAAVREFVSALGAEAAARSCGVLLVAHSRKAARGKDSDPFDPGQVGGVGAWADAARGVLTLTGQGDNRTLAIAKANWGRAFVLAQLAPVTTDGDALVGFDTLDGWTDKKPDDKPPKGDGYDVSQ